MTGRRLPQEQPRKLGKASLRSLPIGLFTRSRSSDLPKEALAFGVGRSIQGDRFSRNSRGSDPISRTCEARS